MIKDLIENSVNSFIDSILMVKSANKSLSSNGNYYYTIIFQDNSGILEGKKWNIDKSDDELLVNGAILRVSGQLVEFRDHMQLKVEEILPVDEKDINIDKFIPSAPCSIDIMKEDLKKYIDLIYDDEIKNVTKTIINQNFDAYISYPAAASIHHAYSHGLLFHSLSICKMAINVAKQYEFLNRDFLIAGSLLHDIGKIQELSGARATEYTEVGNLIGHISLGAMIVKDKCEELKIDKTKEDILVHMILSHHGSLEFGSPKVPMTAEAYALHALDELDAKLDVLRSAYKSTDPDSFTMKISWLDNVSFYKYGGK